MKKYLFISSIVFCFMGLKAQENTWVVPDEQQDKTAPTMFSPEMVKEGEALYLKNCASCHGNPTQDNMNKFLKPIPSDLGSETVEKQTDGSLFFKITTGKGTMPSFKNVLSSSDTWNIISYVRSFHKNYIQPEPRIAKSFSGKEVSLKLSYLPENGKFIVTALGKEGETETPAEGVEIAIFTKRYFGKLKIADNKNTNKDGIARFDIPKSLPGDSIGNLEITAKVVDTEKYGEGKTTEIFKAGIENNKPSLTEKRAMWNVGRKAPWWITFAYPLAVLSVLATIGYILLLLKKIFVLGKNQEN